MVEANIALPPLLPFLETESLDQSVASVSKNNGINNQKKTTLIENSGNPSPHSASTFTPKKKL